MLPVSQREWLSPLQGYFGAEQGMCIQMPGQKAMDVPPAWALTGSPHFLRLEREVIQKASSSLNYFGPMLCGHRKKPEHQQSSLQLLHPLIPRDPRLPSFHTKTKPLKDQLEQIKYSGRWFECNCAWCVSWLRKSTLSQALSDYGGWKH